MSKYFWIIFVLMGLWQFIGSIAERASKKQQDQRVSDLTAQRRRQQASARGAPTGRTDRPQTGPVVVDRAGDLAARRKAQLDELRRRRGVQTGQPAARTRPTPATLRPVQTTPRPVAAAPVAVPQRPAPPVRRQPAARPRPQVRRSAPQPERATRQVKRQTVLPGRSLVTRKIVVEAKETRDLTLPGLGDVPMDRTLLRRMMLYREILEPPIALREVQTWER
jgi:hypothetical protein